MDGEEERQMDESHAEFYFGDCLEAFIVRADGVCQGFRSPAFPSPLSSTTTSSSLPSFFRTMPYSVDEMEHILSIRAQAESIEVEPEALSALGEIGARSSLR